jgi:hypothetical protein
LTIVVLVVLVLVWAVVLGPSLFRRTMDRQSKDSIGSFHRQLRVLGRTGPSLMNPAHRLETSEPQIHRDVDDSRWLVSVSSRNRPQPIRSEPPDFAASVGARRSDSYFRSGPCKRRRDVLMVLVCTLTVSGLLGVIPALHVMLMVTAVVGVALIAYIGLLIRLRNQALERETKLRYLPQRAEHESQIIIRRAASR